MPNLPFTPNITASLGKTVLVVADATPASVPGTIPAVQSDRVRVYNDGTVTVFVRITNEAIPVASSLDVPIATKQAVMLMHPKPGSVVGIAAKSSTTTAANVYFTPGFGET